MAIKVIGAGFGRTGTLSLKHALEQLGFDKSHHMLEVAKSRSQINYWSDIADKKPVDWHQVFEGYQSTTDFPACVYFEELAECYPDAKIVLSVRDEDSWYKSVEQTILPMSTAVPGWLMAIAPPLRRMYAAVDKIVWNDTFGGRADDGEHAKAVFRAHNQRVIDSFPEDRVLVFQAKEGWEPLCRFLDVEVPAGSYPHVNDTAEMLQRIRLLRRLKWLPALVASVLAVSLLVYLT